MPLAIRPRRASVALDIGQWGDRARHRRWLALALRMSRYRWNGQDQLVFDEIGGAHQPILDHERLVLRWQGLGLVEALDQGETNRCIDNKVVALETPLTA